MTPNMETAMKAQTIPGQLWPAEAAKLAELVAPSRRHLEIGSRCGRSLYVAAHAMRIPGELHSVDPFFPDPGGPHGGWSEAWEGYTVQIFEAVCEHLRGRGHRVYHHRSTVREALEQLQGAAPFWSVFIDGDHSYTGAVEDIRHGWPLLASGGVLIGHDYWPPDVGVMRAVEEFSAENGVAFHTQRRIWWIHKP